MDNITLIQNYIHYREIALAIDFCILGINACLLLVLLSQTKNVDKKTKNFFIIHIATVMLTVLTEVISWCTLFNKEYILIYEIFTTLDYFLVWVLPITMFSLVINIINYKVKYNKKIINVFFLIFIILGSLIFIPCFRKLIIVYDEELVMYSNGRYMAYYYLTEMLIVLAMLGLGLRKIKEIGIVDSINVTIFILVSFIAIFIDAWWASTIGFLFVSFVLIIIIGITYQRRLIIAREEDKNNQIELSEMKTKLLLTQIQPHFIYNTLNTLKYLCETDPLKASELCDSFSNYLRANIDAIDDDGLVPFEKELENIVNYLNIEKARFGKRVNYELNIEAKYFLVPVLSIQTIIENSVKKGICQRIKGGTIIISTKEYDDKYEIKVEDDGIGFDLKSYLSDGKNHVGLMNTKKRLEMINGAMNIDSKVNIGTTIIITIPKGEDE